MKKLEINIHITDFHNTLICCFLYWSDLKTKSRLDYGEALEYDFLTSLINKLKKKYDSRVSKIYNNKAKKISKFTFDELELSQLYRVLANDYTEHNFKFPSSLFMEIDSKLSSDNKINVIDLKLNLTLNNYEEIN